MKYYALDGHDLCLTDSNDLKILRKRVRSLYADNLPVKIVDETKAVIEVITSAKRAVIGPSPINLIQAKLDRGQ